jgi:F-type H+-transporting ATPase subunit gamma
MPTLKDIRKRIASVKNTQKITRAMKLVSAAKLRRAQEAMQELRPYAQKNRELLQSLVAQLSAGAGEEAPHPLLARRESVTRVAVLALSSDRGMCGGFNSSAQKALTQLVRRRSEEAEITVFPLGRRMIQHAEKSGFSVGARLGEIITASRDLEDDIRKITARLVDGFLGGEFDEVVVLFNRFQSAISQVVETRQILPVEAEVGEAVEVGGDMVYEPDQRSLLGYLVPRSVEVQVRQAILESVAGEHAARMNAMNSATDNAGEMIKSLTLQANRARQAAITKELMEIIGGAEALS